MLYAIFKLTPFKFNKIHIFETNYENIHPAERAVLMAGENREQEIDRKILKNPTFIFVLLVNSSQTTQTRGLWLFGHPAVCFMFPLCSELACL